MDGSWPPLPATATFQAHLCQGKAELAVMVNTARREITRAVLQSSGFVTIQMGSQQKGKGSPAPPCGCQGSRRERCASGISSRISEQPIIAMMSGSDGFEVLNITVWIWLSLREIALFAPLASIMVVRDGEKLPDLAALIAGREHIEDDAPRFVEALLPAAPIGRFLLREYLL